MQKHMVLCKTFEFAYILLIARRKNLYFIGKYRDEKN